jgi:ariadne-1
MFWNINFYCVFLCVCVLLPSPYPALLVCVCMCGCGCAVGEEGHEPCSCAQLAEWSLKCVNESETANWILANTRKCPACTARIEKNQGCNHMTCRQCKHEFCWVCMGKE